MAENILIVDDERAILFAMREFFSKRGYRVDCAGALEEALELLGRSRYAVIIADLRLDTAASHGGLELLAKVRQLWPGSRFILLTAYGSAELERDALLQGADAFLHKPQPLPAIERLVAGMVGGKS